MRTLILILVCCAAGLAGCSSSDFTPNPGPFSGRFVDGEADLGVFTFTVTGGLIGGTGSILHNGSMVNVSISGVISDKSISGQVVNAAFGAGEFDGRFVNDVSALGTFSFLGNVDQVTTTGTWTAEID